MRAQNFKVLIKNIIAYSVVERSDKKEKNWISENVSGSFSFESCGFDND